MAEKRIQDFATAADALDDDLLLIASDGETYNIKVKTLKDAVQGDADRAETAAQKAAETAQKVADSVGNIEDRANAAEVKAASAESAAKTAVSPLASVPSKRQVASASSTSLRMSRRRGRAP